ncbi:MAG: Asp-tRNA(Asn)/Glu-tRNA(Gln) amidotransferase subunit GatB [Planctomycetes bacterium]|nr:Asp-tRNA(Asn)/Glu-tRNA(Gln) amidotransferase subunit GatB [Planctomycetota bacterium]
MTDYEVVIGLELHAQLATRTKLFCGCSTAFGAPPNSQTCPVCLGMPGVLPMLNRAAFDHVVRTALALHCRIDPETAMDRKNYYYPDLPKNYQISQNARPIGVDGWFDMESGGSIKRVRILNVHLEEDAGKLIHPEDTGAATSRVDLNRAGTPLVEIVTGPDLRSVEEAKAYMESMRQFLVALGVSDCKMQEGSLRFEASISLRPFGQEKLGPRVEIKNVNSVRFVLGALECEIRRQTELLNRGESVPQQTVLYDVRHDETRPMRSKEHAEDYRYFPEPDLVPLHLSPERLEAIRATIPELPLARKQRFMQCLGLSSYDAGILVEDPAIAGYFEACAALHADAKAVSNLITNEVLRELKERRLTIDAFPVRPEGLADLLRRMDAGEVSKTVARDVLTEMVATGRGAGPIIEAKGLRQIGDEAVLRALVLQAMQQNPKAVSEVRAGKSKARGALVGPVMRATQGKADPGLINRLIQELLNRPSSGE